MAEPIRHELKTHMTSTKELTTSAVGIGGEPSHARGLQVSEKVAAAILEETSSSIADMIEELSQIGGSEVPVIEVGGASTSAGDVVEESSQPEKSHERVSSPTLQPGRI